MSQKILAVVGATGQQGGSVIRHVKAHPKLSKEFKIRAITRNPEKASLLGDIEVVRADLNDVESLTKAFEGCDTVFGVTNYWERCDKEFEKKQGINIADAAKAACVRHLIWSSSTNVNKLTKGTISDCEYFDNKAEVMEYIEETKGNMLATYPTPAVFMQMFRNEIRLGPGGTPVWYKPWDQHQTRVPYIDAQDSGVYVVGILLQDPESMNGKKILGVADWQSPQEILDVLSAETGTKVEFRQVSPETFQKNLPEKFGAALTANMVWMRDYGYFGPVSGEQQVENDRILGDLKVKSWKDYVRQNGPWEWQ